MPAVEQQDSILIVDDNGPLGELLEEQIQFFNPNLVVHRASSLREAVELYQKINPFMIFLDWKLGDGFGPTFLKGILKDQAQQAARPVVVGMTGHHEQSVAETFMEVGAWRVMKKPWEITDLEEILKVTQSQSIAA